MNFVQYDELVFVAPPNTCLHLTIYSGPLDFPNPDKHSRDLVQYRSPVSSCPPGAGQTGPLREITPNNPVWLDNTLFLSSLQLWYYIPDMRYPILEKETAFYRHSDRNPFEIKSGSLSSIPLIAPRRTGQSISSPIQTTRHRADSGTVAD